jgi:hypothetical protein
MPSLTEPTGSVEEPPDSAIIYAKLTADDPPPPAQRPSHDTTDPVAEAPSTGLKKSPAK